MTDETSGVKAERPGLQGALEFLRDGDTLVVWRLDRLGRSLEDLVQKVEDLQNSNIGFRSLQESIDTTSPSGRFQFHVFSALAEFERDLIRARTGRITCSSGAWTHGRPAPRDDAREAKDGGQTDERSRDTDWRNLQDARYRQSTLYLM